MVRDPEVRAMRDSVPRAHDGRAQRHARRSAGCIAATAILLAGCGSTECTEQGDFPTGRFENIDNTGHVFVFDAEGNYYYFESDYVEGDPDVAGVYGIRGDLYTEMTHDYAGSPQVPATYRWTFDGELLTFELVGDDVIASRRDVAYDQQTYERVAD
ncbi:hypothetical protein [Demequina rhizosphaerae]|uniref:hypothetical protein n=1 Tax=Demequina rhizosphaerae TaxID=1638985 RepID=UPI00078623B5|nr:hypothetical protein [Demequina rhizosphaerae]